jgi:hypothetical protein
LTQPVSTLVCRIVSDGQVQAALAQTGFGPYRTEPQSERRLETAAQGTASERQAVGRVWLRAKLFFLFFLL